MSGPDFVVDATREAEAFFDRRAAAYDDAYDGDGPDTYAMRARLEAVLALVGCGPGDALDIGMGPGRLCEYLAIRGWTVAGVDASAEMVARARARNPEAATRLNTGHAELLEYPDASFDVVTATGVLEYASDQRRVLAEVARVLRADGVAVLSIPNPRAVYAAWKRVAVYPAARALARAGLRPRAVRPRGAHPIDRPAFEALLASVGLEVGTLRYTSFVALPTPLDLVLPALTVRLARRLDGVSPRVARRLATQIVFLVRRGPREQRSAAQLNGRAASTPGG